MPSSNPTFIARFSLLTRSRRGGKNRQQRAPHEFHMSPLCRGAVSEFHLTGYLSRASSISCGSFAVFSLRFGLRSCFGVAQWCPATWAIDLPWARGDLLNGCYVGESALSRGHVSGWCPSREGVTVNTVFQL
ncbi:hypothetical protein AAC387_Pa09g2322 [Persea americana]